MSEQHTGLPVTNIPCNIPVKVLVGALEAKGHQASWYRNMASGNWGIRCDNIGIEIDRDNLMACVEIDYPFDGQPFEPLALAIMQVAHMGCRPAVTKYEITDFGQDTVDGISASAKG